MAIKSIRTFCAATLLLLTGCSSEIQVSVEGFGSVTTADDTFHCWAGKKSCVSQAKHLRLLAREPADATATFSGWSGACSGSQLECTVRGGARVQAHFVAADKFSPNPASPVIEAVNGLSPSRLSILWRASKKEKRAQENLSYLVYVSADKATLLDKSNLVSTIAGNMFGEYAFQYQVAQPTDLALHPRVVHVAVAVRDDKGAMGAPALQYDVRLQDPDPGMRFDVITQKASAPPPEGDGEI